MVSSRENTYVVELQAEQATFFLESYFSWKQEHQTIYSYLDLSVWQTHSEKKSNLAFKLMIFISKNEN